MMRTVGLWLKGTALSAFVTGHAWVWPTCEVLHFMGLAVLVGVTLVLDVRLLGLARALPVAPLLGLLPWALAGFAVNLVTGLLFFVGEPLQYLFNPVFWWKLGFIALAGANALVFERRLRPRAAALGPGEQAPGAAKVVAAVSLVCWVAVMWCGRMLPFVGPAF
jgi:hypothetical protein